MTFDPGSPPVPPGSVPAAPRGIPSAASIPPPRPRLLLRLGVPAALLAAAGGLLVHAAGGALQPPVEVDARPVVLVRAAPPIAGPAAPAARVEAPRAMPARRSVAAAEPVARAAGWIEPSPAPITVGTLVPGTIAELPVLEGRPVPAGGVVARLVDDEYRLAVAAAEAAVAVAAADLEAARAAARRAETDWEEPVELERAVAASRAAVAAADGELARLPARLAAERAVLAELEDDLARRGDAANAGASSAIELSRATHRAEAQRSRVLALEAERAILRANADAARAELRAAERRLDLRAGDRERLDAARAAAHAAEAHLRSARADLDRARLDLERTVLRAPEDGVVLVRHRTEGDRINPNMDEHGASAVVMLYDPARLQVRVDVPLGELPKVRPGQACRVELEALPGIELAGRVDRFVGQANIQRNTLQAKVLLDEVHDRLRPEMLARVTFLDADAPRDEPVADAEGAGDGDPAAPATIAIGPAATAVRVELDLLEPAAGNAYRAWIVDDLRGRHGRARMQVVTVAGAAGPDGLVTVAGGLNAGDLVIDPRSAAGLSEGRRVRIRRSHGEDAA